MREFEWAYAAGLMDGEGTITLQRERKRAGYRRPLVELTSTSPELIAHLHDHYGGVVVRHKTYQAHHKPCWNWRLVNDQALAFLAGVAPYLREREKRRRAWLLIDSYKKVTPRNGRYSPEQTRLKEAFECEFFEHGALPATSVEAMGANNSATQPK